MTNKSESRNGTQLIRNSTTEFLIFAAQSGGDNLEVRYADETIWLTQKLMAKLFGVDVRTINEHLKNIFNSGELIQNSVIRNFRITAADGKTYNTQHYNLDAIISVGYRVNSLRATQFRQWATAVLRDFAVRGYVLDRKRMENGHFLGEDFCRFGGMRASRPGGLASLHPPYYISSFAGIMRSPRPHLAVYGGRWSEYGG
ncbi:virulence RhuM family protein [Desulfosarcina sp. OttesenSCG-928-B08]|nr:virulence RhuM family protein [Desulfosarcina sp. OttesenSCG-928-B08]